MKVILLQKISGVGDVDDIKDVADGYARNFLFPKHLAVQASKKALADLAAHKQRLAKEGEGDLHYQQSLADRLSGLELTFKEKASEKGLLYSAVTPAKIAQKLAALGYEVDRKQIETGQIKTVGDFVATVRLRHGLEAELAIIVVSLS